MNAENSGMSSSKPYLLRAIYEWIADNGLTPHILVDATQRGVKVPSQHVRDGRIVLNISPNSIRGMDMGNEWISFSARFSGTPFMVYVPLSAVLALYAKENGQGMAFQPEAEDRQANADEQEETVSGGQPDEDSPPRPKSDKKPMLRRVK